MDTATTEEVSGLVSKSYHRLAEIKASGEVHYGVYLVQGNRSISKGTYTSPSLFQSQMAHLPYLFD